MIRKFLVLLFLISCAGGDRRQEFVSQLDTFFSSQISADGPGGAVLILKDTTIIFSKALGEADVVRHIPITTHTLFNVGSISKTFVANGILILQEQGKLSVDDNILQYFPDFKNKGIAQKVRIRHLLTHTSGLPDNRPVTKDSVFYLTADDAQNWYPITQADTLEFEPGTQYHYSNPAFNALALIIEKVSGMPWREFIRQNIFLPSGMTTSTITDGPHPQSGVAHGHSRIAGQWREDDFGEEPTFCAAGNGGVWSSVEELAKYEIALRNGSFLKPLTFQDSRTIKTFPGWKGTSAPDRGWSWQVSATPDGFQTAEHSGHQGGFAANYVSIPDKGILIVVLYNAPYDVYSFREKVMNLLKEAQYLN